MAVERDEKGRIKKGSESLNPHGRSIDQVARLKAALAQFTNQDVNAVFRKMHDLALDGDVRAAELFLAYAVGKPLQRTEVSSDPENPPLVIREVVIERQAPAVEG